MAGFPSSSWFSLDSWVPWKQNTDPSPKQGEQNVSGPSNAMDIALNFGHFF